MKTVDNERVSTMIQVQFEGSERELIEYVLRNRSLPPRASKKTNWKEGLKQAHTKKDDVKSRIMSYRGIAKGIYPSAKEAVSIIRNERNSWD